MISETEIHSRRPALLEVADQGTGSYLNPTGRFFRSQGSRMLTSRPALPPGGASAPPYSRGLYSSIFGEGISEKAPRTLM